MKKISTILFVSLIKVASFKKKAEIFIIHLANQKPVATLQQIIISMAN